MQKIADSIAGSALNEHGQKQAPDSEDNISRFSQIQYYLRPIEHQKENQMQYAGSGTDVSQRLSDIYYAFEQAFLQIFKQYNQEDLKTLIMSLSRVQADRLCTELKKIAAESGFIVQKTTAPCTQNQDESGENVDLETSQNDSETDDIKGMSEEQIKREQIKFFKNNSIDSHFFFYKGSFFQGVLSGQANLQHLMGLALLLHKKQTFDAFREIVSFCPECLVLMSFLGPYRKNFNHGNASKQIPTEEQLTAILDISRKIIQCLLPESDLSADDCNQMQDLSAKERRQLYYQALAELTQKFGYSMIQKMRQQDLNNLTKIQMYISRRTPVGIFQYIQGIDNILFNQVGRCGLQENNGEKIKELARCNIKDLPELFYNIDPLKLTVTMNGRPQSLRANILCLMASPNFKHFFTPQRVEILGKILEIRTHDWVRVVTKADPDSIVQLGKDAIQLIKEIFTWRIDNE